MNGSLQIQWSERDMEHSFRVYTEELGRSQMSSLRVTYAVRGLGAGENASFLSQT